MDYSFSTLGAIIGLVIAIVLSIKKVHPAYSLILGALVGGLIGGGGLTVTVNTMVSGASSMMSSVLRIMTSGILAGALIKTGSAEKIAETIVEKLGQKRAILAISIATMLICAVGVFIDISVITVAPIAIAIGRKAGLTPSQITARKRRLFKGGFFALKTRLQLVFFKIRNSKPLEQSAHPLDTDRRELLIARKIVVRKADMKMLGGKCCRAVEIIQLLGGTPFHTVADLHAVILQL